MTLGDTIGWTATAVFTASYLTREHSTLRRVQMAGASLWLAYGLVVQAPPVVGSNILVLSAACWAEYRHRRTREAAPPSPASAQTGVRAEAA
jgi:hypothetical protein